MSVWQLDNQPVAAIAIHLADDCQALAEKGMSGERNADALWLRGMQPLVLLVGVVVAIRRVASS
jgi:hypothetical protein